MGRGGPAYRSCHEPVATAIDRLDDPLISTTVANRAPRGLDPARKRRLRHEPVTPDLVEEFGLRHHTVPGGAADMSGPRIPAAPCPRPCRRVATRDARGSPRSRRIAPSRSSSSCIANVQPAGRQPCGIAWVVVVRLAPENRPGAIDKRPFWFLVQQRPYFAELVLRTMADRHRRQTGQEAS